MSVPRLPASRADELPSIIFDGAGAAVVHGALSPDTVKRLRDWTDSQLRIKPDENHRHPKHESKLLVNNVGEKLGVEHPDLLLDVLLATGTLGDGLLGIARLGSLTMHVTEPGVDSQTWHVDYPLHSKSGQLWDTFDIKDITTHRQRNNLFPYMTVQVLFALQDINESNGCTQVVTGSHLWDDVDTNVLSPTLRDIIEREKLWSNTTLSAGDALVFNRRTIHRAACNRSDSRRRACIAQLVMPFAVPQQVSPSDTVVSNVLSEAERRALTASERERVALRLWFPYPCNTERKN